jgi:hypothetical protein
VRDSDDEHAIVSAGFEDQQIRETTDADASVGGDEQWVNLRIGGDSIDSVGYCPAKS